MTDDQPAPAGGGSPSADPEPQHEAPRPGSETPPHVRDRLQSIADRLRALAQDLGGEVMVELPSRLGDHEGLLLALANELEQLVK